MNFLERCFKLKENNTNVRTEVFAGLTTFMTMAYILIVNPSLLSAAGMDYGSDRRFDCKAARIRYRMVYTDKLNRKNSEPDRVSGRNAPQLRFKIVAVLKEFVFENSERKLCSVNRNIYIS